jgi:predicted methyltransferase
MRIRTFGLVMLLAVASACVPVRPTQAPRTLEEIIASDHRTEAFRARDQYRHPQQTLEFFGLRPDMNVVEVWPAPGWYTEILAPYLREQGSYTAAGFLVSWEKAPQYRRDLTREFKAKLDARPDLYDRVKILELGYPDHWEAARPGSADLVLTFRNVHNWVAGGYEKEMFNAFYRALKPGGILGVVDHRAAPGTSLDAMKKSGYVTENLVIEAAEASGFRLVEKSEINANPKDTKDYPEGVWTLPPSLRLGDKDRQKYLAIGESDRMTLRFMKPIAASAASTPR